MTDRDTLALGSVAPVCHFGAFCGDAGSLPAAPASSRSGRESAGLPRSAAGNRLHARAVGAGLLLLAWAGVAGAQLPLPIHVIPFAAGSGADGWRCDLTVANLGSREVLAGVRFFPEAQTNAFDGTFTRTLALGPGEVKTVNDVVGAWFSASRDRRGWLLIADATPVDCASGDRPYPALLAVTARLRRGGAATMFDPDWLHVNVTDAPSVFPGVGTIGGRGSSGRVELGVANISTAPLPVRIELAESGKSGGSAVREVPPLSFAMWSLAELGLAHLGGSSRLEVEVATPGDPCTLAHQPPPCADPCDHSVCPQRYRFPATPAFYAFVVESTSGSLAYRAPVIDFIGAQRAVTAHTQKHCPDVNAAARITDLFGKLALLREPAPTLRKVGP